MPLVWCWGVWRVWWCLVNKASGRLAGMRGPKGPATRLKRDVRPVLGVMSDGRRVCVRDGRQHLDMCVLPRKYCLAQAVYVWETEKGELHSSQQKSPPPDSLVTFQRSVSCCCLTLLLLPRGVAAESPAIQAALTADWPRAGTRYCLRVHVYKACILCITSCELKCELSLLCI